MTAAPHTAVDVLDWAAARRCAQDAAQPLPAVRRPLDACAGLVLAAPLRALSALPAFDTCAMDGYAVAGSGPWSVVGQVLAGSAWSGQLEHGTAVAIATGAPVPAGTTAVLPVEDTLLAGDLVDGAVQPGRHVRPRGEECAAQEELLAQGTRVTAAVLGLAAATGHDALEVHPRPRVAALITGDELLRHGLPGDGRVRDALGPQLSLLVAAHGGELVRRQHVPDDPGLLTSALDAAQADLVVTTGASSAGPADHLRAVLVAHGATVLVDGVACRPGHPQLLARLPDGRLVVGLPGNPLAALVATATVLAPALAALAGRTPPPARTARLAAAVRASPAATRLVPVRLRAGQAEPVRHTGSGMLRGAALADALAVVPSGAGMGVGDEVEVLELP